MNYIKYPFIICIIGFITACEDFLDRPPLDAVGNDSYWLTSADLDRYVLKYYPQFQGHGSSQALLDANSDNLILGAPNSVLNGERPITTGNWINQWSNIRSINILYDHYHKV